MPVIKNIGFIIIVLLLFKGDIAAQDDEYTNSPSASNTKASGDQPSKFNWQNVSVGGVLGLQFGSTTIINISPTIDYRFTEDFLAGIGISYLYYGIPRQDYSSTVYGGGPFARYLVFENLFAHIEYQILNSELYVVDSKNRIVDQYRENVHYFWVGAGYQQELGSNAYLMLMVLYDLNESDYSIYPTNPTFRMGISVGL